MQLQDAINLVQAKFQAESKDETDSEAVEKYHEAFDQSPVMMEIATQIFGVQIIQQNAMRQMAAQQAQGGDQAGGNPGGAVTAGGQQPGPVQNPFAGGAAGGKKPEA